MKGFFYLLAVVLLMISGCKSSKHASSGKSTQNIHAKVPEGDRSKNVSTLIQAARKYLGSPYKYSGLDHNGMDCSGLMYRAFAELHISLPHSSAEQSKLGLEVGLKELKPGDLIFMGASKGSSKVTHVGMVVQVTQDKILFIHASTRKGVVEENLLERWYEPLFIKGARLF